MPLLASSLRKTSFGFKEWVLVCDALGRGEQSLLLRKGGIAEGKQGFGFEHREFYLFPTWFHAQVEKLKKPNFTLPEQDIDNCAISYSAIIEWSGRVNDLALVRQLSEFHVLHDSVIEERFQYHSGDESLPLGIHVAFVRIYRLEPSVTLPMEPSFGGCRSWVELPEIVPAAMVSVLSDEEHHRRRADFAKMLKVEF